MDSGSAHGLYIPLYACRGKNMQVGEKKYHLLRKKDNLLLTFTVRHIIWNAKLGNNEKTLHLNYSCTFYFKPQMLLDVK